MAENLQNQTVVRIPNLPMGRIVDKDGRPTDEEMFFRQSLLSLLLDLIGAQGVVIPSQTQTDADKIAANTVQTPNATGGTITSFTCQLGTMLYIPSTATYPATPNDQLVVAMDDGTALHAPTFKTITVT
jgi:hypothetical protein